MPGAVLTVKGQTTIPKKIRDYLKLQAGDRIDFVIENDGSVIMKPATIDIKELDGVLHRPGRPAVSLKDMETAVKKHFRKQA